VQTLFAKNKVRFAVAEQQIIRMSGLLSKTDIRSANCNFDACSDCDEQNSQLTVVAQVVVEHLEYRKRVPRVRRLLFQHDIQIDSEQRPERLGVINHGIGKPWERLDKTSPASPRVYTNAVTCSTSSYTN